MIAVPSPRAVRLGRFGARHVTAVLAGCMSLLATLAHGADASSDGAALLQELRTLSTTGRVLHVGAHPDDENTQLIAYLSRGRGYDTAYLSITRGDGGQNILGSDFDEKLGVARTQELLAARRIDGGRQFFTRAIDFGFSKNPEETLAIWNHEAVLGDVVRVIRMFRPDVIVTRFPIPPGSGGHGHHTASAILAVEAFKLAGDPKAYPEQLTQGLKPWQPKRIVWNSSGFSRGGGIENNPSVKVDIGGNDPVTGEPFGTIAARSRAMHKTQGFGDFGGRGGSGARLETFVLLGGEPAQKDFMDGVDTSWARESGGADIGRRIEAAAAAFARNDPAASVPALLAIRRELAALPDDIIVTDKRAQLDHILQGCLGLSVSSRAEELTVVPGETIPVTATVTMKAPVPVHWVAFERAGVRTEVGSSLSPNQPQSRRLEYAVAKQTPVTQPYWLRKPGSVGMYHVDDPHLIGRPVNPPALPMSYTFAIDGQTLVVTDELTHAGVAHAGASEKGNAGEGTALPVAVIPRVALRFSSGPALFRPGATTVVSLDVVAGRPNVAGTVTLDVPPGWRVSGAQRFSIQREIGVARVAFEVTAPAETAVGGIGARARTDGEEWTYDAFTLHYPHIPTQLLQPPARKRVVSATVATRGHAIGYLPGAGDDIPDALRQLGYAVTTLEGQLTADQLKGFDAVVVGVRAFNTRTDLATVLPALFAYAENGGTVVCQYNWARNLKTDAIAPYRLRLSDSRVTDENARVTILAPEDPLLTTPNKISAADFEGWVQERGVYFPTEWDEHFTPLLAMNDPGEQPLKGALLVARHGKGVFVYTSLAFFRQLPAGVPGAYRLFANLVSAHP